MTKQLYLTDTYLFDFEASINEKKQDDTGHYILLDQTIFYPQGGGQPSDQGIIIGNGLALKVISVRQVENEIRHYLSTDTSDILVGQHIICQLAKDRRLLNTRYHTAAHLLGNIMEIMYPALKTIKGHSFPNEAYVEFQGSILPNIIELQNNLNQAIILGYKTKIFEISQLLFEQKFYILPYQIPGNKVFRVMQIKDFTPVPCHVAALIYLQRVKLALCL